MQLSCGSARPEPRARAVRRADIERNADEAGIEPLRRRLRRQPHHRGGTGEAGISLPPSGWLNLCSDMIFRDLVRREEPLPNPSPHKGPNAAASSQRAASLSPSGASTLSKWPDAGGERHTVSPPLVGRGLGGGGLKPPSPLSLPHPAHRPRTAASTVHPRSALARHQRRLQPVEIGHAFRMSQP